MFLKQCSKGFGFLELFTIYLFLMKLFVEILNKILLKTAVSRHPFSETRKKAKASL